MSLAAPLLLAQLALATPHVEDCAAHDDPLDAVACEVAQEVEIPADETVSAPRESGLYWSDSTWRVTNGIHDCSLLNDTGLLLRYDQTLQDVEIVTASEATRSLQTGDRRSLLIAYLRNGIWKQYKNNRTFTAEIFQGVTFLSAYDQTADFLDVVSNSGNYIFNFTRTRECAKSQRDRPALLRLHPPCERRGLGCLRQEQATMRSLH